MKTNCPVSRILSSTSIGRLLAFQKDPFRFFDEHSPKDPHATHMPVALRLGYKRFYFCYDPTHAKHILQDQRHKYSKSALVLKKNQGSFGSTGADSVRGRASTASASDQRTINESGGNESPD
jgi:hypothetical protein